MKNPTATDCAECTRTERLADICAQLENRGDGIVSLLGTDDLYWLITEVNRLRTLLAELANDIDSLDSLQRRRFVGMPIIRAYGIRARAALNEKDDDGVSKQ